MWTPVDRRSNQVPLARACIGLNNNILFLMLAGAVCGAMVPMLGPIPFGDFVVDRSSPATWISFAIGAPAIIGLIWKDPKLELGFWLRVLWTLAFAAFAVHVWTGADPARGSALIPPQLLGMPASGLLLVVMWAVTVWSAWKSPDVIWPQAIILLVLGGSTIVTTYVSSSLLQWMLGGSFALAVIAAMVRRGITLSKDITAIERGPSGNLTPTPPDVGVALLAQQAWRDLQGKEVQLAATYSYLWLADQVGHFGLGMGLSIFLGELTRLVVPSPQLAYDIGFAVAAGAVIVWEVKAYRQATRPVPGPFPIDNELLLRNAIIAALYMLIGTIEGWACRQDMIYQIPILVAVSFLAVVAAKPWVRQKIVWQKAGLPYLFRLSDARHTTIGSAAQSLQAMVMTAAPPGALPQQFVIAGPVHSGRTLLACGIGTELAFRDKKVRYLSLDRLIEFASPPGADSGSPEFGDDSGPSNIDYWPWTEAQVIVIDDIGPVMGVAEDKDLEKLLHTRLARLRKCMVDRHTVWIVGDLGQDITAEARLKSYASVIRQFCNGQQETTRVLLESPKKQTGGIDRLAA